MDEKEKVPEKVPYVAYESALARMERINLRQTVIIIIQLILIIAGVVGFIIWRNQIEVVETTTIEAEQESESGSNFAVGGDFEWHGNELE